MNKNSYQLIYEIVKRIPYGKVATYGQVAELANLGGKARLVGYALFQAINIPDVPWQRVVNAQGQISFSPLRRGNDYLQRSLLQREGIEFTDYEQGKLDLKRYQWSPVLGGDILPDGNLP